jgi:hypothetical protein
MPNFNLLQIFYYILKNFSRIFREKAQEKVVTEKYNH